MTVEVVYETHATSDDNEAEIATGWPAGGRAGDRLSRDASARARRGGVLIIDHVATRYALEVVAGGVELEEVIAVPFAWQPGWEYVL